jgi:alkanesulfonate monooxygenase SsuD/methylene tetrahydromethanopterin reductase-like flavin-dependent oxidoreductase (luciferase family)
MKVRIGISLGVDGDTDPAALADAVAAMEDLRFDSLWLAERITTSTPDPVAGLGFAAARTRRLKLGTGVMVLPGRNPVVVAKQLATLDRLSAGRLLVTFGLGGEPGERAAFPVPPGQRRGDAFDEALRQVRQLLDSAAAHDDGDHGGDHGGTSGDHGDGAGGDHGHGSGGDHGHGTGGGDLVVRPATVQRPLEFWVAGTAPAAQRRAGRLADGWLTSLLTPDEARQGRAVVEEAAEQAGRRVDPEHFGVSVAYTDGPVPATLRASIARRRPDTDPADVVPDGLAATAARLEDYIAAGFSKFVVRPAVSPSDWPAALAAMAAVLLPLQR